MFLHVFLPSFTVRVFPKIAPGPEQKLRWCVCVDSVSAGRLSLYVHRVSLSPRDKESWRAFAREGASKIWTESSLMVRIHVGVSAHLIKSGFLLLPLSRFKSVHLLHLLVFWSGFLGSYYPWCIAAQLETQCCSGCRSGRFSPIGVCLCVRWSCWGWTSCQRWSADCRRASGHRWEQVRPPQVSGTHVTFTPPM